MIRRTSSYKWRALAALSAVGVTVSLASCSPSESFADSVTKSASQDADTFTLPSSDSSGGKWTKGIVLCPYGSAPKDSGKILSEAADKIDSDSDDSKQWIILLSGNKADTISISRESIDFCTPDAPDRPISPNDKWTVQDTDGARQVQLAN